MNESQISDDNKTLIQKIVNYLKDFKKETATFLHFLDKGALLNTDRKKYYMKFDTMYWILAGKETGRFTGAGFALNSKYYNIVNQFKTDVLYTNRPRHVYHYLYDNYERNSFNHIQSYNSERVRVISIALADDIWLV